jgi:Ulp1 family protease
VQPTPQQINEWDCGLYVLAIAHHIVRDHHRSFA